MKGKVVSMFEKIYYYDRGKRRGPVSESEYLKLVKRGKVPINGTYTIDGELYHTSDLAFKKLPRGQFRKLANKSDRDWDGGDERLGDLFESQTTTNKWWKFW